eukprot:scaffold122_cov136-Isochrysis_galbana.AAC.3
MRGDESRNSRAPSRCRRRTVTPAARAIGHVEVSVECIRGIRLGGEEVRLFYAREVVDEKNNL